MTILCWKVVITYIYKHFPDLSPLLCLILKPISVREGGHYYFLLDGEQRIKRLA